MRIKLKVINYLHIDTQGNDLNVLKVVGSLIKIVKQGVMSLLYLKRIPYIKITTF